MLHAAIGCSLICSLLVAAPMFAQESERPPVTPLIAHDPYFSVWSNRDKLTDSWRVVSRSIDDDALNPIKERLRASKAAGPRRFRVGKITPEQILPCEFSTQFARRHAVDEIRDADQRIENSHAVGPCCATYRLNRFR